MGYAEASAIIHAPIEAVWNTLNDIKNTPKWVVGLVDAEVITGGTYGLGSAYKDYNRLGMMIQVTAWEIIEFEPMTTQVHISYSESLPSTMTLMLWPIGDTTKLTMCVDYQLMWRWHAVSQLFEHLIMNRILSRVLQQNIGRLDQYLQRQADPARREQLTSMEM